MHGALDGKRYLRNVNGVIQQRERYGIDPISPS